MGFSFEKKTDSDRIWKKHSVNFCTIMYDPFLDLFFSHSISKAGFQNFLTQMNKVLYCMSLRSSSINGFCCRYYAISYFVVVGSLLLTQLMQKFSETKEFRLSALLIMILVLRIQFIEITWKDLCRHPARNSEHSWSVSTEFDTPSIERLQLFHNTFLFTGITEFFEVCFDSWTGNIAEGNHPQ